MPTPIYYKDSNNILHCLEGDEGYSPAELISTAKEYLEESKADVASPVLVLINGGIDAQI